jgi:predicted amidohydrolase
MTQDLDLLVKNATVVTGDGKTVLPGASVVIHKGMIDSIVTTVKGRGRMTAKQVIDATGKVVIPGVINMHVHSVTFGPGVFGELPSPCNYVLLQLYRHLVYGTTTLLSVDGLQVKEDVDAVKPFTPLRVLTTTLHTAANVKMAKIEREEYGLTAKHESTSADAAISQGAVAVGQAGCGLALANMWYRQIPRAIKKQTGRDVGPIESRALFEAVVGREVSPRHFDRGKLDNLLSEFRLADVLSVDQAKALVEQIVLSSYDNTLESVREAATIATRLKVPLLVSNNSATQKIVSELSETMGSGLIAVHSNHPSFEVGEALQQARHLKKCGAIVEISSGDFLGARRLFPSPELTFALLRERLVDLLSTDFAGGYFDPILLVVEAAIREGVFSLAEGVALCTSGPANAIPKLAPNRGVIAEGRVADLAIVEEKQLSNVHAVVIDGRIVMGPCGM